MELLQHNFKAKYQCHFMCGMLTPVQIHLSLQFELEQFQWFHCFKWGATCQMTLTCEVASQVALV